MVELFSLCMKTTVLLTPTPYNDCKLYTSGSSLYLKHPIQT